MTDATKLLARIRNGAWLDAQVFPPPRAGELVDSGECSPMCLLAEGDQRSCGCSCGGDFHGVARGLVVETRYALDRAEGAPA